MFIDFTVSVGLTVISAQAGIRPLLTAFLTDLIFDQTVPLLYAIYLYLSSFIHSCFKIEKTILPS